MSNRLLSRSIPLFALLALVGAGGARAQMLPGARPTDNRLEMREFNAEALRGVSSMLAEWRGAWARDDAREAARFYTDDALLLIGDGKPLRGRQEIQTGFGGILSTTGVIQVAVEDFLASGNVAYAYGNFWYPDEQDQDAPPVTGTYVMLLRRDGRNWKIRSQMFSATPAQQQSAAADAETTSTGTP
ncbi:MAG TPA: DUF4440 domain-containing protein [Longimicrobiaceae bacterium]|jgi:uncharacterized protein (TIGR02246 family)